jgi:cytochrome c peroxidase
MNQCRVECIPHVQQAEEATFRMTKRSSVICITAVCATIIPILCLLIATLAAQAPDGTIAGHSPEQAPEPTSGAYNPYPPGILPADLQSEIKRVRAEARDIEAEALAQWKALPAPVITGQPPKLQNTGTEAIEILGKLLNFDENMSPNKNRACAFCHMPYVAFSGPIPSVNLTMVAYPSSSDYRANKRTAQRYTYSPYLPVLKYVPEQAAFLGGNFWDSRATGYLLRNPDSEQAQHPPVDPGEMSLPDTACIAFRLSTAEYRPLFEEVFGAGSLSVTWPVKTELICDTPGGGAVFGANTTPISLSAPDRNRANTVYNDWGQALDAYENSLRVSPFSSKFDAFLAGKYKMTSDEMAGYNLFNGKGNCNSCHLDGRGTTLMAGQTDTSATAQTTPLFTCFGSANEGLPLNPRIAFYYQTKPDADGFTNNPYGFGYRDLGLGGFVRSGFGSAPSPNSKWTQYAPSVDGQMQVMTARNVAMVPPQCATTEAPGPYFQKEFFHNGYIKSLKQLVHFYNTRDVYNFDVTSGHCPPGRVERVTCWPEPEIPNNIDMTSGKLGLTDREEDQIVAFLQTLTDGYTTPYPDINTYTGKCMVGGTAATQGNDTLIPTPTGVPCAAAVCGVSPPPKPPIPSL